MNFDDVHKNSNHTICANRKGEKHHMEYEFQERGVSRGSELFLSTPSKLAESLFFYLHRCGRFVCTPEYQIRRDNFNNYFLFYVEKGKMHIENEGRSYIAQEGDMGIINCHLPHCYEAIEEPTIFRWIHFSGSNTFQFYEHIVQRNQAVFRLPEKSSAVDNLDWLLAMHRHQDIVPEPEVSVYIHSILCELLFIAGADHAQNMRNPLIEQALSYIRQHYQEPLEVKDIASEVNLSLYHFARLFKQEVGYSPHEYIVIMRMNAAKKLLKSTDLSVAEIAARVGYEYSTSFTSVFTKKVGSTPKKFRDMLI